MELALLVWLVDLLGNLKGLLIAAMVCLAVVAIFTVLIKLVDSGEFDTTYVYWKTALTVSILVVLIPSEKTIQYMAGAYLIQTAYQSEFVNKASELGQKAILNQLSKWDEDNPEVKTLLESATNTNVTEAKTQ